MLFSLIVVSLFLLIVCLVYIYSLCFTQIYESHLVSVILMNIEGDYLLVMDHLLLNHLSHILEKNLDCLTIIYLLLKNYDAYSISIASYPKITSLYIYL